MLTLRVVVFALLAFSFGAGTNFLPAPFAQTTAHLKVHEWGTFTSVAGGEGGVLEWRPLSGARDLPSFVYDLDGLNKGRGLRHSPKSDLAANIRMETPVLYFYADREMIVSAKVDFPEGRITEWYPQARTLHAGIDWGRLTILPGAQVKLPVESSESHYYPARETDADTVRVGGKHGQQHEKFLFYRGVGNFALPLVVRLRDEKVILQNNNEDALAKVILFESKNGKLGYITKDIAHGETVLDRPALDKSIDYLRRELEAMLVAHGLYKREAAAMLKTWQDTWFEDGLRVFYIMPRKTVDKILPLTIEPQPSELVRVLVGRTELMTPEMEENMLEQLTKLGAPSKIVRAEARKSINQYGRFAEPLLKQVLGRTSDPQVKARIEKLLKS